jgi:hypothetical protein
MPIHVRALLVVLLVLRGASAAQAEILVRWSQDQIPSRQSLGITTLVIPATNPAAIGRALGEGYRVFAEVEAAAIATAKLPAAGLSGVVVRGAASSAQLTALGQRLKPAGARVIALEERGKWPHIRTNWVTRNNDVLQVTRGSSQPWIESNAALIRMLRAQRPDAPPTLSYPWTPITVSDKNEGPALENYLVAIAEAGSFGGDLVLPLHDRFQQDLVLGQPQTRLAWSTIKRHIEFYSWGLPDRYQPIANIGVVTGTPAQSFEVMNLLLRHNLPFELIAPTALRARSLSAFKLLIVLEPPDEAQTQTLTDFVRAGGTVILAGVTAHRTPWREGAAVAKADDRVTYRLGDGHVVETQKAIADPNTFALDVRQLLGRDHRVIDIWNGITVVAAPYANPDGKSMMVAALNYAHQALPVQIRVRGTYSVVQFESPDDPVTLLPYQHRDGFTEVVVPNLRIGGRVFFAD